MYKSHSGECTIVRFTVNDSRVVKSYNLTYAALNSDTPYIRNGLGGSDWSLGKNTILLSRINGSFHSPAYKYFYVNDFTGISVISYTLRVFSSVSSDDAGGIILALYSYGVGLNSPVIF